MIPDAKFLGIKLKQLRLERGLDQKSMALKMKVSRETVSKIESGRFNISVDRLLLVLKCLDCELVIRSMREVIGWQKQTKTEEI